MNDNSQNNLSNNKALSDNKVCLFGDFKVDIHLEELACLFFVPIRSAMIQTRLLELYKIQTDTIASILYKAKEIVDKTGIQINPLPAKFGLPALEKMSLEIDDKEMQEQWAKLLVAAGKDYNPIHIQYAEVLSQLNNESAKLLKTIYDDTVKFENDNISACSFIELEDKNTSSEKKYCDDKHYEIPKDVIEDKYIMIDCCTGRNIKVSNSTLTLLLLLERLNLIRLSYYKKSVWHIFAAILTPFGYSFVETLENVDKI